MNAPKRLVSIVCPAYQEEAVLPVFHEELSVVLAGLGEKYDFEIVYVDDGSRDGTLASLRQLASADRRVHVLSLSRNFGQQAALTAGLEFARGDAVISMDADLQHPPAVLPQLLERWQAGHEVVITIRQEDQQLSFFKRFTSRTFYQVMSLISATDVRLAASDFRLLSRKALMAFLQMREQSRFVRGMVQWLGFPTAEIAFQPHARRAGQTKYTLKRMLHLAGDGLFSFSSLPLRLPLYAGLVVWLLAACQLLVSCLLFVLNPTTFSLATHYLLLLGQLVGGGVLCGLGVIGEYLGRVYDEVKRRPHYVIKEVFPMDSASGAQPLDAGLAPRREAA
jgi:glycosyltransferase involved in cell wall biosynthesis